MAGLVREPVGPGSLINIARTRPEPSSGAIRAFVRKEDVDTRDKPAHDEVI
jgi:hypothetical protein